MKFVAPRNTPVILWTSVYTQLLFFPQMQSKLLWGRHSLKLCAASHICGGRVRAVRSLRMKDDCKNKSYPPAEAGLFFEWILLLESSLKTKTCHKSSLTSVTLWLQYNWGMNSRFAEHCAAELLVVAKKAPVQKLFLDVVKVQNGKRRIHSQSVFWCMCIYSKCTRVEN